MKVRRVFDISQPVSSRTACFPGDVPFSRSVTVTYADSRVINLTAMTMSPHVGTHADAPSHIQGDFEDAGEMAGALPLEPFVGTAAVIDLAPFTGGISWEHARRAVEAIEDLPERLLFRTQSEIRYEIFEDEYSFFTPDLISALGKRGIRLMGIDTPSVDHVRSKSLDAHHCLNGSGMVWLENLDLSAVKPGQYFLAALPLKLMELEASPVRAVLLELSSGAEQ